MQDEIPHSLPKFFLHFARKQPWAFTFLFLSPISIVLKANVVPFALKLIVDAISDPQVDKGAIFETLRGAIWLGGLAWIGLIVVERCQFWIQSIVVPKFEAGMRMSVLRHTVSHSFEYFNDRFSGSIVNKVTALIRSVELIRKIVTWNIITAASVILVAVILMYTVAPIFSFIVLGWIFLQIVVTLYFVKHINRASGANAEDKNILSGLIVDMLSNMASVKLFARELYELSYIQKAQSREKKSNGHLIATMNMFCLSMDIFVTSVLCITFYFLIKRWQTGSVTPGDIVFIFYMIFSVMNQMWQLGYALSELFREVGIARQALKTIAVAPKTIDYSKAAPLTIRKGKIEFKNVVFTYGFEKKIFHNMNLTINSGEKLGIVGYSGSGKSTFVNLLLRFYDLNSGSILIDEQDIARLQQKSLRENVAVVLQDNHLFHRSILENICYGKLDASQEEILSVAKKACCHEFIEKMPQGYNTLVGERGVKLSGGQRQRISIARALLKKSPIVIFDEATSALDSVTEYLIQKGLDQLVDGKTLIVIAHRLSTLLKMDRIVVFNEGRIVEDGKHEDLLNLGGHYAHMWNNQVNGFIYDQSR